MGEMAEMMLDGTLCEGCGSYIDDEEGEGFPRYCSPECARGAGITYVNPKRRTRHMDEKSIRALVEEQAKDEGLWFHAETCAEAYVQQALRDLHAVIEGRTAEQCAAIILNSIKRGWGCE